MIELREHGYYYRNNLHNCRMGDGSILERVKLLFEGNEDLLIKFRNFLPQDSLVNLTRVPGVPTVVQNNPDTYPNLAM